MKSLFIILSSYILCVNSAFGSERLKFMPGDIILTPMNCYLCKVIEKTTNSIYSHLFIYLGKDKFAHSLSKVELIDLAGIKKLVDKSRPSMHLRHIDSKRFSGGHFLKVFMSYFKGLSYDKAFLWDNVDENGREKLYCSEFVAKFYAKAYNIKLDTLPMEYNEYREFWRGYFEGEIPDGLPGMTPSSFDKSEDFKIINKIHF